MTTLGYALLALLAREELSGYDLAQRLKERVAFFWQARHSQIYPELARLEAAGLVRHTPVPQQGRPDKKVYVPTGAGRDALAAWLTAPLPIPTVRDELVLRAYAIWLADPARAAALFREHERRHLDQLAEYEGLRARLEAEAGAGLPRPETPLFSSLIAVQRGIGYEREYAAWCGWVAGLLEGASEQSAGPKDRRVPVRDPQRPFL